MNVSLRTFKNDELRVNVKALYEKIATRFKVVDVLINNAATLNNQNAGDIEPALWWHDFVSYPP